MSRIIWFNTSQGASGDMLLASFISAGLPIEHLTNSLSSNFSELSGLQIEKVPVGHIQALRLKFVMQPGVNDYFTFEQMEKKLLAADLKLSIKEKSLRTILRLAKAEEKVHETPNALPHELGHVDTLLDVVGFFIACDYFEIENIYFNKLVAGNSPILSQQNCLPSPQPVVLELVKGFIIEGIDVNGELTTPTGAGILTTEATQLKTLPELSVTNVGYSTGTNTFENHLNLLQCIIGNQANYPKGVFEEVAQLSTNVDDAPGEIISEVLSLCLKGGALDVWLEPIFMKKNRPASCMNVLCNPRQINDFIEILERHLGTLGVRVQIFRRHVLQRKTTTVVIDGIEIKVKLNPYGLKPELDDVIKFATTKNIPIIEASKYLVSKIKTKIEEENLSL